MSSKRTWSKYQEAIFETAVNGTGSILVDAKAGASKTTSVVEAVSRLPEHVSVLMMAFNKSIADELKQRVPSTVATMTYNACGNRALRNRLPKAHLDANKVRTIVRNHFKDAKFQDDNFDEDSVERNAAAVITNLDPRKSSSEALGEVLMNWYASGVTQIIDLARQFMLDYINDEEDWSWLIRRYDINFGHASASEEKAVELAKELLAISVFQASKYNIIDFTDQLYLPILWQLPFPKFDFVVVDEAQDTNKVQREIIKAVMKSGARLMAVGDPNQAIYGFRGADANSMQLIAEEFKCNPLPLSISYRCSKAVIREAQKIVPEIEYWESSAEGSVSEITIGKHEIPNVRVGDAILCRNTAPLITLAYNLIKTNRPIYFAGGNIGEGLISLIKSLKASTVGGLRTALDKWFAEQVEIARKKDQPDREEKAAEKYDCILAILEANPTVRDVESICDAINRLFVDPKRPAIYLSTMHRSKGLEWNNVFIYMPSLCPSKYARQQWQMAQEANLMYVAITRAKVNLTFVEAIEGYEGEEILEDGEL